ncbi:MAG: hypothetical protein SNF33_02265 [Candidatus Algichlamydia australiensis]|nr:hypothetical protein [Chlamydiales bacterium]
MDKLRANSSSLGDCLKELGLSSSPEIGPDYGVLRFGNSQRQIILLRKNNRLGGPHYYPLYNPFSSITYFESEVAQGGLNRKREIGILRKTTEKSDQGSVEEFWNGEKLIVNHVAYKLMKSTFVPSPSIDEGFCFHSGGLTVRGHSRNLQSERAFLEEAILQLIEIEQQFETCKFKVPPLQQTQLNRFFVNFAESLKKIRESRLQIEKGSGKEIDPFFQKLKEVIDLRSHPPNADTEKQIKSTKSDIQTLARTIQREFCNLGYCSDSMHRGLTEIQQGLKTLDQQVRALESFVDSNTEFKRWAMLHRAYEAKIEDLARTIVEDQIASVQGWITRIYSERPIKGLDDVKLSLWQVLAKVMRLEHNPAIDEKSYLFNSNYRKALFALLEEEIKLDRECFKPSFETVKRQEVKLKKLKDLHTYWKNFKSIDDSPIFLNTARQHEEEVFGHVKRLLQEGFGRLSNQLINPTPAIYEIGQQHLSKILLIMIKKMRLEETKFQLASKVVKDKRGVYFLDSEYAKKRAREDLIIYKLTTFMLILLAQSENPFGEEIVNIAQVAHDLICKPRYYGPCKTTVAFLTTAEDLTSHLKKLLSQFSDIEDLLENPSKRIMKKITENLRKGLDEWGKTSEEFNLLLNECPKNAEWWQKCIDLAKEIKEKTDQLKRITQDIHPITADTLDEETFAKDKEEFRKKLIDLNKKLKKRDPLKRPINSLLPMLVDSEKSVKMNSKLRNARDKLANVAHELETASGFSAHDCSIRASVKEKLEELEEVFTENTTGEFFTRTETVRALIQGEPSLEALADKVLSGAKTKLLKEELNKAIEMSKTVSIEMKCCEWVTGRGSAVTHHSWVGSNICEDPYYRHKETHIAI